LLYVIEKIFQCLLKLLHLNSCIDYWYCILFLFRSYRKSFCIPLDNIHILHESLKNSPRNESSLPWEFYYSCICKQIDIHIDKHLLNICMNTYAEAHVDYSLAGVLGCFFHQIATEIPGIFKILSKVSKSRQQNL